MTASAELHLQEGNPPAQEAVLKKHPQIWAGRLSSLLVLGLPFIFSLCLVWGQSQERLWGRAVLPS